MRLDVALTVRFPELSRVKAAELIKAGRVIVDGKQVLRPSAEVGAQAVLEIGSGTTDYVSRGGLKLEAALDQFGVEVNGLVVLDAGLSTGGFTHCLLMRGARRVYGVDVGRDQVHPNIAADPRVVVMEKTDLRSVKTLPESIDLATLDLSFISLLHVIDAVTVLLTLQGRAVALIKPQFEVGPQLVGKGGIVRDEKARLAAVERVTAAFAERGFVRAGLCEAPMVAEGPRNIEYLALFVRVNNF